LLSAGKQIHCSVLSVPSSGQSQDAFADDVALDFRCPASDGL
jgi:hypothetical protein